MEKLVHQLRPDSKGRIALGKLASGVSSFRARLLEDGNLILEPFAEIPAREAWLFDNPTALDAVKQGLAQAAGGKSRALGSFAEYADQEID